MSERLCGYVGNQNNLCHGLRTLLDKDYVVFLPCLILFSLQINYV